MDTYAENIRIKRNRQGRGHRPNAIFYMGRGLKFEVPPLLHASVVIVINTDAWFTLHVKQLGTMPL